MKADQASGLKGDKCLGLFYYYYYYFWDTGFIIIFSFFLRVKTRATMNKQTGKPCQIQDRQVDIRSVQCHMTPSIIGENTGMRMAHMDAFPRQSLMASC